MNNLSIRAISSVAYVAIMLAGLLLHPVLFAALSIFIMSAMMDEFYRMAMSSGEFKSSRNWTIVSAAVVFLLVFLQKGYGMDPRFVSLAVVPIITCMAGSLFVKDKSGYYKFANIFAALVYIAAPVILSNFVVFRGGEFSGLVMLCFFIIIWASDVGAYTFGMSFGQKPDSRKLCPSISPKKSWAGLWGGFVVAVLAAVLLKLVGLLDIPWGHCVPMAIIISLAAVFGDLFESQWKRHYGLKDSGTIIPGHGGMLDRMDSALFAIPAGAVYMSVFNLL